jgi:hypothetical protein
MYPNPAVVCTALFLVCVASAFLATVSDAVVTFPSSTRGVKGFT